MRAHCTHRTSRESSVADQCPQCLLAIGMMAEDFLTEIRTTDDLAAPPVSFTPGAIVADRFRITEFIGRGGMGEIYRAEDLKLGQSVALKFISRQRPSDDAFRFFHDEVRLGRQVGHPSVCRVYDLLEVDGRPFIVMEFIDGEDLGSLLGRVGRLPYRKALEIARDICWGLDAAHEKGIIHGDLKPSNIMIDGRGRARITDFGLARLADAQSKREFAGTVAYMAPEQFTQGDVTRATDIYSLGLVMYEILTGSRAHQISSFAELQKTFVTMPRRPSLVEPRVTPEVEQVVLSCLSVRPEDRPGSARTILAVLGGGDAVDAMILAGETPTPEYVAAIRTAKPLRRRQAWTLLAAAVSCLAAVLVLSTHLTLYSLVPLTQSPALLIARARALAAKITSAPIRDEGYWFEANLADRNPSIAFHYRSSGSAMAPLAADGRLRADDPPLSGPHMVHVVLAPTGQLLLPAKLAAEDRGTSVARSRLPDIFYFGLLSIALIAAGFLARRNFRLKRVDRRGAVRLAIWVSACRFVFGLLASHHPPLIEKEAAHLATLASASLLLAAEVCLAYVALEPLARQRWPNFMISWMRVGQGRWLDAIVGRDVLIGTLAGLMVRLLDQVRNASPGLLPTLHVIPSHLAVETLGSLRDAIGFIFYYNARAIFYSLFGLFLLLLLRTWLVWETVAAIAWIGAMTAIWARWDDPRIDVPIAAIQMTIFFLTLRRFGLLSLITAIFVDFLTVQFPLTIDYRRFYFATSVVVSGLIVGLLLLAFRAALCEKRRTAAAAL